MKYIEIKNIPYLANILVAKRPFEPHIGIPTQNVIDLFRVYMNGQTLYFDCENDEAIIIRVRCSYWEQLEILTQFLPSDELSSFEMTYSGVSHPRTSKEILH